MSAVAKAKELGAILRRKSRRTGIIAVIVVIGLFMIGNVFGSPSVPQGTTADTYPSVVVNVPSDDSQPSTTPTPSSAPADDPRLFQQALGTIGGETLKHDGLQPAQVLPKGELTTFLNTQQGAAANSTVDDTYVVFNSGAPKVNSPTLGTIPDGVVGLKSGTIVALGQEFADGRGTLCYNSSRIENLAAAWLPLNQYLRSKSLGASYRVSHADVDKIPAGDNNDVQCYLYIPS